MKSKLLYVIQNKNRYEKEERKKRKTEVENLKREGMFRVALDNQLSVIRNCLEDPEVTSVIITVEDTSLIDFGRALGYEEMKDFQIRQAGSPQVYRFRRKEVAL